VRRLIFAALPRHFIFLDAVPPAQRARMPHQTNGSPMTLTAPQPNAVRHAARRLCAVLLAGCAFVVVQPGMVRAQDVQLLLNRLNRLENEVQTLNQQVYRGGGQPVPGTAAAGAGLGSNIAADFEVRLTRLERELQVLTGRYEEATYGVAQMRERLDTLQSDLDYRLSEIESKLSTGDTAAAEPSGEARRPSGQSQPAQQGGAPRTEAPQQQAPQQQAPQQQAAVPSGALPNGSAQQQYDYAFGLLRSADYPKAEAALQDFLKAHPDHSLAPNAQYWLAETYYVRQKYRESAVAFAEGYQKAPKGSKAPDNLLKLGMSLAALSQRDDACLTLTQLGREFPDASAAIKRRSEQERSRLGCS
jgi:tol-pal system protein YbgF